MKLVNQTVVHKIFGEGIIVSCTDNHVVVRFKGGDKKFLMPDSFTRYIKCKDKDLQAELEAACAAKAEAEEQQRREAQARMRAEEAARVAERHAAAYLHANNDSNLVFKCNFCNGGCSDTCIGFKGACSDDQIRYNIEERHHKWCSYDQSPCCSYLDGQISRAELDAVNENGGFACYESRMLTEWIAAAGEDLGERQGGMQGRRINDASSNSLAVLTTRYPQAGEEDRIIFGVFITGDADEGNEDHAGYVKARDGYAIELTPDEAVRMKFWHYYKNTDGGIRWNQGLYRYLRDSACARILADIVDIKTDPAEKAHAEAVLEYYCTLKGISAQNIPAANGAI